MYADIIRTSEMLSEQQLAGQRGSLSAESVESIDKLHTALRWLAA
jgi:hypothetical protein